MPTAPSRRDPWRAQALLVQPDRLRASSYAAALRIAVDVEVSGDIASARSILRRTRIDGLVLTQRLPDGLGLELAWELRGARTGTAILLHSRDASRDVLTRAAELGVAFALAPAPAVLASFARSLRPGADARVADCAAGWPASPRSRVLPAMSHDDDALESLLAPGVDLTAREREVIELGIRGIHGEAAAATLGITVHGYRRRVARVLSKTGHQTMRDLLAHLVRENREKTRVGEGAR